MDIERRFSAEQINDFLREAEAGGGAKDLWLSKFSSMSAQDAKPLNEQDAENAAEEAAARQLLENDIIKDALRKSW